MTRSSVRLGLAVLVLVGSLAIAATPASSQPADPPVQNVSQSGALEEVGACLADRHELSVLFLIDESMSLQQTDPDAVRVDAIQTALQALRFVSRLEVEGETPDIEVQFASFALGYQTLGEHWVDINAETVQTLSEVAELFEVRNVGFDTDFVAALDGAQAEFSDRVSELTADGGRPPCQLLLWFTDGAFNVIPRETEGQRGEYGTSKPWAPEIDVTSETGADEAIARGRELLCGADDVDQPIVDQIRADGIINVAVALATDIGAGGTGFLESVATGRNGGNTCGTVGDDPVGEMIPAQSVEDLVPAFVGALLPGTEQDPDDREREACVEVPGPECTRTFVLDPGLRQFNLLGLTDAGELEVILTSPTGDEVLLENGEDGTATVSDVELEWTWVTDSIVSVAGRMDVASDAWVGEWSAAFMDRTGEATISSSQIFVFGNLRPEIPEDARIVPGESVTIPVDVVAEEGTPEIPAGLLAAIELGMEADLPDGPVALDVVRGGAGDFEVTVTAPDDLSARQVELTAELVLTTQSGIQLNPVVRKFRVPVGLPEIYPTIVNTSLELPAVQGTDAAHGEVEVAGSAVADGCVWVEGVEATSLPEGVESLEVSADGGYSSADDCLEVPEDETVTLALELHPDDKGDGRVQGLVRFGLSSAEADDTRAVELDVSYQLSKPPLDEKWFVGILLALLIPGVLLPLLFFWFVKYLIAKFAPPGKFRAAGVEVDAGVGRQVTRRDPEGAPLNLRGKDIDRILPTGGATEQVREFTWSEAGLRFWSRTGWKLFAPPEGRVAPIPEGGGRRLVTGTVNQSFGTVLGDGSIGDFPLSLGGSWVFEATEADLLMAAQESEPGFESGIVPGYLWLIMEDGIDPDREAAGLDEAIQEQLPDALARLIDAVVAARAAAPSPEATPGDSPPDVEPVGPDDARLEKPAAPVDDGLDGLWGDTGGDPGLTHTSYEAERRDPPAAGPTPPSGGDDIPDF